MAQEQFRQEVSHKGLNKYRVIKGTDYYEVQQRASALEKQWEQEWERKSAKMQKLDKKAQGLEKATDQTQEALSVMKRLKDILTDTISTSHALNWDALQNKEPFKEPKPQNPTYQPRLEAPDPSAQVYQPKKGIVEFLFKSSRIFAEEAAKTRFANDYDKWQKEYSRRSDENIRLKSLHEKKLSEWEARKKAYETEREVNKNKVAAQKQAYLGCSTGSIVDYCESVLSSVEYPESFPQTFTLNYNPDNKILVIEYDMPNPEQIPTLKEVKYVAAKNEFKEYYISDAERKRLYDDSIYKLSLSILYVIFSADAVNAIDAIAINGTVNATDRSTGQPIAPCILSIVVKKDDFLPLNLSNVVPKDCFKKLKGIASSTLYNMAAVAPLIKFNKDDKRIIEGREIMHDIDDSINLAAMDWQDFEHFVRELMEKEFSNSQGEVKVTRSSRDEGVDAIAFDPDPIRGGKIVIQAKRYTNTVGVSAVRDLYGTVMNEGATKGILITTSDFGPDSYEFAKDKPIALINGSNLLFLLEKHGTRAKIDLLEAKKTLAEGQ